MTAISGPELLPESGEPAKQLVILLHGLGSDGNDLINLAPEFADALPDAHFISPDAPFACDMAPIGYQWFSLLNRDPELILDGVREAAPILDGFITEKLEELGLDDSNLALIGFSQGTMMALHTALRRENKIAGVLGYSGSLVGAEHLGREMQSKPQICLIHGDADEVVPFESLEFAENSLSEQDIEIITHERPNLGHSIDYEGIEIGKKFLKRCFDKI
jgi:phospholipase/carboxylesterase